MQPVSPDLLALVQKTAPPAAEIVPLAWAFEDEDYNIAIVMPNTVERLEARQIEDRLIDAVMDYDAAPAWVCTHCGGQYVDAPVYKRLEAIARHRERMTETVCLPLAADDTVPA